MSTGRGRRRRKPLAPQLRSGPNTPNTKPLLASDDTPEERRAAAVRRLVGPGERRRLLAKELREVEAELRPAVADAIGAGLPYRRIEEITGIPRATVARWAKSNEPASS